MSINPKILSSRNRILKKFTQKTLNSLINNQSLKQNDFNDFNDFNNSFQSVNKK